MSDIDFHRTVMGHRFYESTMPELVRQLTRLNSLLERLVEKLPEPPARQGEQPQGPEPDTSQREATP